jgi:hypothetical protein
MTDKSSYIPTEPLITLSISLPLVGGDAVRSIFFFLQHWGLNSGPTLWATPSTLICEEFFLDRVLWNYLPGLASNCDPPYICLLIAKITGMSHQPSSVRSIWWQRESSKEMAEIVFWTGKHSIHAPDTNPEPQKPGAEWVYDFGDVTLPPKFSYLKLFGP